ncbi:KICSTOR complex protein kaptin isoform X1 [Hydra vulgaris]|uniref:KICSTOR complex protein kaptin isoform X1 n=1 Tax=Hydra vulgaris TaxID=6087 RepID=UPI00064117CF|nr:KICSTOR complex protein kaptin [Hydra vulgaris]XP_047132409.1 KICSTOR complex protein kaptin [Hydra vulgaris]XP_047132410.1 KICSTOR complex protein kaptin [Hydra vulgaris]
MLNFYEDDEQRETVQKAVEGHKNEYKEIFYINNGSQSNIYCSAKLRYPATTQERLLVGTLKGKVSCLERNENIDCQNEFHSCHDMRAREVYFSYIPGDAEIISMDSFYRHQSIERSKCLVVGVTLILLKPNESSAYEPQHYFNIYIALEPGTEFDLDKLAQVCQHQRLDFAPYHLHHAEILVNDIYETVFLLAGSDEKIHLFKGDNQQCFAEEPCGNYFPEFNAITGRVIWMHVKLCDGFKRLSAFGCDNGYLRVAYADSKKNEIIQIWTMSIDGPITSVRLFTLTSEKELISPSAEETSISPRPVLCESSEINLLVTSAIEIAVVYLNVVEKGLNEMVVLDQSDHFDSVTCSCITDLDCDGNNEIILGTYGQELLTYKWNFSEKYGCKKVSFYLACRKEFPKPIISTDCLDIIGDGMQELVVVSLTGMHILQHEVESAAEKLLEKIIRTYPDKYLPMFGESYEQKDKHLPMFDESYKQKDKHLPIFGENYEQKDFF